MDFPKDVSGGEQLFPCDECDYRVNCTGACELLRKFLREDLRCHTKVRTTELMLPPGAIQAISDWQIANPTRLSLAELAEGTPGYWDITNNENINLEEKEIFLAFYVDGMPYKQIAQKYQITPGTVYRLLHSGRVRIKQDIGKSKV